MKIMRRMGKIILVTACCLSILLSFTGCPGQTDWEYYLTDNYSILHVHSESIVVFYEPNGPDGHVGNTSLIGPYISEFCYSEQYLAVKQMDPETMDFENFESNDFDAVVYYLVDMVNHQVYGPYATKGEFDAALGSHSVNGLSEWKATRPNPNLDED